MTFKGSKNLRNSPESILPSVTGRTAPKMYYRRPRDIPEDTASLHAQPPPTPVGAFSTRDGSDQIQTELDLRENHVDSSAANADDHEQPPSQIDEDKRLEKITEKADDDYRNDRENISIDPDAMPEDAGLSSFEAKKDISQEPQENNVDKREDSELQDITNVTLHGQNEPAAASKKDSVVDRAESLENKEEVFITNKESSSDAVISSVGDPGTENDSSDLKTDFLTEEEIPTQIHVTITEKQQDPKPN